MARRDSTVTIRNFAGLNRRDAGERVRDNQFYLLQNWYQATKGFFYKRFGTSVESAPALFPGAREITGIHRNYGVEKCTLYHCEPDATPLFTPSNPLTLEEIASGNLFNGGAVQSVNILYKLCGFGTESAASDVQSFTVSANTKGIRITVPAFPSGAVSANIFAAIGGGTFAYIGTVFKGGTNYLDHTRFIGVPVSAHDDFGTIAATASGGGSLRPGYYYVALAWLAHPYEEPLHPPHMNDLSDPVGCQITASYGKIVVTHDLAASTNGATCTYVFVGTKHPKEHPMTCVGIMKKGEPFEISSIPNNTNAQSHPDLNKANGTGSNPAIFNASQYCSSLRNAFIIKKDRDGNMSEVMPSRTISAAYTSDNPFGSDGDPYAYSYGSPRSKHSQADSMGVTAPVFTWFNGLSYFANSIDIPWQTDGYSMGQMTRVAGTILPKPPKFIGAFQNSLLTSGGQQGTLMYACNAYNAQNWAVGGSGTALRFVSIGDNYGDSVTAQGIFTLATEAVNDPRAYFLGFKKHGIWMKDTFPDPTSGVGAPLQQLSGRAGCTAYRSITQTPMGIIFLGSDADVYLIRGGSEPVRLGTSVQSLLDHLRENDTLMSMVTAVFHDNHYKLAYPSSKDSVNNDAELWADLRVGPNDPIVWTGPHAGVPIGAQIVLVGESDDMSRIACRADALGTVKLDDVTKMDDLGGNIVSVLESKKYRFKDEAHMKRILGAILDAYYDTSYTHDLLVEFFADSDYQQVSKSLSNGSAVWDSSSFDSSLWGGGEYQAIPCPLSGSNLVGRTLKIRITHQNKAQFILAAAVLQIKPERRLVI